jgi:DNA-binding transcriptional MerR regulator
VDEKQLLSSGEVARELGIARWQLLYLIERGTVPGAGQKVAGRRLFSPEDLRQVRSELERLGHVKPKREIEGN